ncbi:MAG TPA: GNAT family N-acetyltransferase [Xanthobacteraceae bacterium]|nr:GNAT family N-acetyltransferase [Xanthobacteraceae bacterium]
MPAHVSLSALRRIRIRAADTEWHGRFFGFVADVFGIDFTLWAGRGGWRPDYDVFALVVGDEVVSTIGRTRMRLVVDGETRIGFQLGAVATCADFRRRGLSRQLMEEVIAEGDDPDQPIILFANDGVLGFYPRFGFRRVQQQRFGVAIDLEPAAAMAPVCDVAKPDDRAWLADLCARARPVGQCFAAHDYYPILLWHLTARPVIALRFDELDAAIVVTLRGPTLTIRDVLAVAPFELRCVLTRLTPRRVLRLEFGFDPQMWWPDAEVSAAPDDDGPLFVRGLPGLRAPLRFPDLAQT